MNNKKTLVSFVQQHAARSDSPDAVDVGFFKVAMSGEPDPKTLRELIAEHRGVFNKLDPLDGQEHNYIMLGGWIGDQGLALLLMGLGAALNLWKLLTPQTVAHIDNRSEMGRALIGQGLVSIQAGL